MNIETKKQVEGNADTIGKKGDVSKEWDGALIVWYWDVERRCQVDSDRNLFHLEINCLYLYI